MYIVQEAIESALDYYQEVQKSCMNKLKSLPTAKVYIKKVKKYTYYYTCNKDGRQTIPDPEAAEYLLAEYLQQLVRTCKNNINCLSECLSQYQSFSYPDILARMPRDLGDHVQAKCFPVHASISENKKYASELKHETDAGTLTISKSEKDILNELERAAIPYQYEGTLVVNNIEFHPDIMITRPRDGVLIIWEHVGLTDNPAYLQNIFNKIHEYIKAGYIPGLNLILTFGGPGGYINIKEIRDIIKRQIL